MYKLRERRGGGGRGGGEVIWAMTERKHLFLKEVFPYPSSQISYFCLIVNVTAFGFPSPKREDVVDKKENYLDR